MSDMLLVHNNPRLSHQWRGSVKETSRGRNRETNDGSIGTCERGGEALFDPLEGIFTICEK